ncbi:MAG TPA: hypothetical protein VOB72_21175 [Candidatus Dormibacteraeota bacterium]|nr:hypothetical protein [Candidatus Dormibacteraeota bacterium]
MSRLTIVNGSSKPRRPRAKAYDARTAAVEMVRHRRAWRVGPGHFRVFSRDGLTAYRVLVTPDGETSCTCTAGRFGRACYHAVIGLRRVLREGPR